jgi:hypothetical protein
MATPEVTMPRMSRRPCTTLLSAWERPRL